MGKKVSFLDIKTHKKMSDESVADGIVVQIVSAETKTVKKGTKYSIAYHGVNGEKNVEVSKGYFDTLSKLVVTSKKLLLARGGTIAGYEGVEKVVASASETKPGRGNSQYPSNR